MRTTSRAASKTPGMTSRVRHGAVPAALFAEPYPSTDSQRWRADVRARRDHAERDGEDTADRDGATAGIDAEPFDTPVGPPQAVLATPSTVWNRTVRTGISSPGSSATATLRADAYSESIPTGSRACSKALSGMHVVGLGRGQCLEGRRVLVRPRLTAVAHYGAPGGLWQDPGRAAESPTEARIRGNEESRDLG